MSKYQKLFSLSENLYAEGAPLIISAGALQKDTENGSVFAQIKFKNIDNRTIKAVRVVISSFDDFGKELGDKEYLYQDISARRDDEFGQKMPVVLDNATRSFSVKVTEVAFEDGSKWTDNGTELKPIEKQEAIKAILKEHELIKQYHIKYGNSCEYIAKADRDLVLCSCGEVNKANENLCHKCRNNLSALLSPDVDALTKEKDARLAKEAKEAEEKRIAEEKAAEEAKKRAKKSAKIAGIVAACAAVCIGLALLTVKVIVPTVKYNNAVKMMNNEQYDEAITAFEALDGYKDSAEQINDCQEAIKERDYNAAVELMNNEQYEEAIAAFEALDGYKDSEAKIASCKLNYIKNASVGDIVYFGAYEQDNNRSNGKEDIEWQVLTKEEKKILVISKYALECRQFNTSRTNATWDACSLRKWLNKTFINEAFTEEEQAKIVSTRVTLSTRITSDKVFLLSITETEKYFTTDELRRCAPTAYAKAQGAYTNDNSVNYKTASGEAACFWFLRSPGGGQDSAASVWWDGSIYDDLSVLHDGACVRPAIWISLE